MNNFLIKSTLLRGFRWFFRAKNQINATSYEEREGNCIFSECYFFELGQRYANSILFCYKDEEKKLYLVASSGPINNKINDYQVVFDEFNSNKIKGDIKASAEPYSKLWNASAYMVNNFGIFDGNKDDKVVCLYEECKVASSLSILFKIRKFRRDLDLYKTIKSRKIRSLYNNLGSLVSGYSNGHERDVPNETRRKK